MSPSGNRHCSCGRPLEDVVDACFDSEQFDLNKCSRCRGGSTIRSSSSSSLLSFELMELKDYDKKWRVASAAIKGFTIGAGLKGGLSLFAVLARLKRRGFKNGAIPSVNDDLVLAIKETIRYGFFLGSFAGTFVTVDEVIAHYGGHLRTAKWRALLAGAIAGPSMLHTGLKTTHTSLAIYIFMRAAVLASRCGIKSKRFGHICRPLTWAHGDIFLMCLSSSQILSAYILRKDSLTPSYISFLNKHGGKVAIVLQGVKEIAYGWPLTSLEEIEKYYKSIGVNIQLDSEMKVPCSV